MLLLVAFVLALLAAYVRLLHVELWKLPTHEIKRRARMGTFTERAAYRVRAYGNEATTLFWVLTLVLSGSSLTLFVQRVPTWLGVILTISLLLVWFGWMPFSPISLPPSLVRWSASMIEWLLRYLSPFLRPLSRLVRPLVRFDRSTGIYEKDDLLALLERQQAQADNRVMQDELAIAWHALNFGDKIIHDYMTPRRVVQAVKDTDEVGPILLDELHKSGHSRFPVYQADQPEHIVGMLYIKDLVEVKSFRHVSDAMRRTVYYVQEDAGLDHALQAFIKTKTHLFVVVNNFAEITGVISIEDVIEQIVGKPIIDEFDKYDDMRAVAAVQAKAHRKVLGSKVVTGTDK